MSHLFVQIYVLHVQTDIQMSVAEVYSKKLKLLKSRHRNKKVVLIVLLNKGAEEL